MRLGGVIGCKVLLIQFPATVVGIWHSLTFSKDIGILSLGLIVATITLHGAASIAERGKGRH